GTTMLRPTPTPLLSPYTTLFRSVPARRVRRAARHRRHLATPSRHDRRRMEGIAASRGLDGDALARAGPEHLGAAPGAEALRVQQDRKSTRLNSSHQIISYAVFCL